MPMPAGHVQVTTVMRQTFLVLAAAIGFVGLVPRADAQTLLSFRCTFGPGVFANWDNGKLKIERGNFGKPSVELVFDAINLKSRTGRMIGNNGAADLVVISSDPLTLLEVTDAGNPILTSIFIQDAETVNRIPAVMSRHVSFFGAAPSQYYGHCKAL
jgi:hypothetical protein